MRKKDGTVFHGRRFGKIYFVLKREGVVYFSLLILMLLVSMLYNNNLSYLVLAFFVGIAAISMIFPPLNLSGLKIELHSVESGFNGSHARISFWVQNVRAKNKYNILLEVPFDDTSEVFSNACMFSINAREQKKVTVQLPLNKRGHFASNSIRLTTHYPFGFFRSWTWKECEYDYYSYPCPEGYLPFPSNDLPLSASGYEIVPDGDDFSGHKNYELGDSYRHVDWKLLARGLAPMTKVFSDEQSKNARIQWSDVHIIENLESKLSQIVSWYLLAMKNNITLLIELPDNKSFTVGNEIEARPMLESLAMWGK